MASKMLGRTPCLLKCGHEAAHVKIKTDKEPGKAAFPYVYCPGCGSMCHTKTDEQAAALARLTRAEKTDPAPVPVHVPTPTRNPAPVDVPEPKPTVTPPPAPKPHGGLFSLFGGAAP